MISYTEDDSDSDIIYSYHIYADMMRDKFCKMFVIVTTLLV